MYAVRREIEFLEASKACELDLNTVATCLRKRYANLGTLAVVFSKINVHLKGIFGEASDEYKRSKKIMKLNTEEVQTRIKYAQKRKWEKNENPLQVKRIKLEQLAKPPNDAWENLAIKCAICTGLRLIEILCDTQLDLRDDQIEASFLAKKKIPFSHTRPVIFVPAETILKDFHLVREKISKEFPDLFEGPGQRREGITKIRITQVLGEKLRKHLHTTLSDIRFHDLRALYAALSFSDCAAPEASFPCWIAKVLGHEPESLDSVLNYYPVKVV